MFCLIITIRNICTCIEAKTVEITQVFRRTEQALKKFNSASTSSVSQAELVVCIYIYIILSYVHYMYIQIRNNIQRSLETLSVSFRSSQKEYMNKLKTQMTGPNNLTNIFDLPTTTNNNNQVDHGFNSEQMRIVDETNQVCIYI